MNMNAGGFAVVIGLVPVERLLMASAHTCRSQAISKVEAYPNS